MATGETGLETLLRAMEPVLDDRHFLFAAVPHGVDIPGSLHPVMRFDETEAISLVITADQQAAAGRAGIRTGYPCRMITLTIHSSLEAVGFLATLLPALAAAEISVNAVSAWHHDHLFVPADRADDALAILQQIARNAG